MVCKKGIWCRGRRDAGDSTSPILSVKRRLKVSEPSRLSWNRKEYKAHKTTRAPNRTTDNFNRRRGTNCTFDCRSGKMASDMPASATNIQMTRPECFALKVNPNANEHKQTSFHCQARSS